jgi:hypothetical protein
VAAGVVGSAVAAGVAHLVAPSAWIEVWSRVPSLSGSVASTSRSLSLRTTPVGFARTEPSGAAAAPTRSIPFVA